MVDAQRQRRAQYARLLSALWQRSGLSQRQAAARIGISAETFRSHLNGTSAPATRAKVRAEDEVLGGQGALELALYGELPAISGSDAAADGDAVADLARQVERIEAELSANQSGLEELRVILGQIVQLLEHHRSPGAGPAPDSEDRPVEHRAN